MSAMRKVEELAGNVARLERLTAFYESEVRRNGPCSNPALSLAMTHHVIYQRLLAEAWQSLAEYAAVHERLALDDLDEADETEPEKLGGMG